MEKFLVALDNSTYIEKILPYIVKQFRGRKDIQVVIVHIKQSCMSVDDILSEDFDRDLIIQKIEELKRNKNLCKMEKAKIAETIKEKVLKQFSEINFDTNNIIFDIVEENGDYAQTILDKAKEHNCKTIILGKKGDSIISEYLIGSTAERVSRFSKGFTVWLVD